jgi:hypothetical protein
VEEYDKTKLASTHVAGRALLSTFKKLQNIISQKNELFTTIVVRTSYPKQTISYQLFHSPCSEISEGIQFDENCPENGNCVLACCINTAAAHSGLSIQEFLTNTTFHRSLLYCNQYI